MTNRQLTLMNHSELYDCLEIWLKRMVKYRKDSIGWKYCSRKMRRIEKEIRFKELLRSSFQRVNKV